MPDQVTPTTSRICIGTRSRRPSTLRSECAGGSVGRRWFVTSSSVHSLAITTEDERWRDYRAESRSRDTTGLACPQTMTAAPALRRALGRWDLTALGVNQVIGGAIFLWPAQVAAQVGAWSPIGFVLIGLLSLSVALCFAELSSRFETTGGPYVFTRAAFGDFVGFEIGWMQWFSRATSQASIMAATAVALGYYWPALTAGWPRAAFMVALTLIFGGINIPRRPPGLPRRQRDDRRQARAARAVHRHRSGVRRAGRG